MINITAITDTKYGTLAYTGYDSINKAIIVAIRGSKNI